MKTHTIDIENTISCHFEEGTTYVWLRMNDHIEVHEGDNLTITQGNHTLFTGQITTAEMGSEQTITAQQPDEPTEEENPTG